MNDFNDSLHKSEQFPKHYRVIVQRLTNVQLFLLFLTGELHEMNYLSSSASSVSSFDDESEDEIDATTELQARFLEICHVITDLYHHSPARPL